MCTLMWIFSEYDVRNAFPHPFSEHLKRYSPVECEEILRKLSHVKIVSSSHPYESSSAFLGFQPCCMIASSCRSCTDTWRESTDHFPANRKRKEIQCHNRNLKCRLRAIYKSNKARRAHGRSDESCTWETVRCPPAIASGERARNG